MILGKRDVLDYQGGESKSTLLEFKVLCWKSKDSAGGKHGLYS